MGNCAADGEEARRLKVVSQVRGNCLLVPCQPDTWHIRNMQLASFDLIGLLQDRVGPILPLDPVRRFADPHDVRGYLWIEIEWRSVCPLPRQWRLLFANP